MSTLFSASAVYLETMSAATAASPSFPPTIPASRHMSWCCEAAAVLNNVHGGPCPVDDSPSEDAPTPPPPDRRMSVADANALSAADFRRAFGNVVECCPDAAAALAEARPFAGADDAVGAAAAFLDALPPAGRERVLLMHPELAGRLARRGLLTAESQREQQAAGVMRLPRAETERLADLTARYRERFGFPYVVCVLEKNIDEILRDLENRLENSCEDELRVGIDEVKKICRLRIYELITADE